ADDHGERNGRPPTRACDQDLRRRQHEGPRAGDGKHRAYPDWQGQARDRQAAQDHPRTSARSDLMNQAFICDAVRTPFARYSGALSSVRADDLGAVPIKALIERNRQVDWTSVDDLIYGCANQAGEDNRNVGRMSALLAGLPVDVPANTVNRLCGSSL